VRSPARQYAGLLGLCDAARKALHDKGQPSVVHEVMARRIIAAARKGERDVWQLRKAARQALANSSRPVE